MTGSRWNAPTRADQREFPSRPNGSSKLACATSTLPTCPMAEAGAQLLG
jgi:hypothetical protein